MRIRMLVSILAAISMAATMHSPFTTQAATAATAQPLDLAAMVLLPSELPEHGYGIRSGQPVTVAEMAQSLAEARHGGASVEQRYARELISAGWEHGYVASLGLLDPNDPSRFASTIETQIIEFSLATGAAKGFAVTDDLRGVPGMSQRKPASRLGEQALITVDRRLANDRSNPRVVTDLTFQDGNLVASVFVVTFGAGAKPAADSTLVRLGTTLAQRIATVRQAKNAPQLSTRALLLTGPAINTYYANYERLARVNIPYASESPSALKARDETYKTNGVTDVFYAMQTSGVYGIDGYGLYSLHVERFARQVDAVSWLQRMTPASVAADGTQTKATEIKNAPRFGDESITYRYSYIRSDTSKAAGYVVILRTGRTVASVQIDGAPGVSLATVGKVASAQAACQKVGDCRKPLKSPLAPPSNTATPAAVLPTVRAAGVL